MPSKTSTLPAALLFSAISLIFAKPLPAVAEVEGGETAIPSLPQPWYDLPANARDPFSPPTVRTEQVEQEEGVGLAEIQAAVKVSGIFTSQTARSAIVNNRLVRPGDTISVEVVGKEIALRVVDVDSAAAGVVLSHEGQEFFIARE